VCDKSKITSRILKCLHVQCFKIQSLFAKLELRVYLFFVLSSNCVLLLSGFAHRILFFIF